MDSFLGTDELLGGVQVGEGFSRAAGHDELTALRFGEAVDDVCLGSDLMRTEFFLAAQGESLRVFEREARPVDRTIVEILNAQAVDRFGRIQKALFSIRSPFVCRGNNDAGGKTLVTESGEVGVEIGSGKCVFWQVKLALDGAKLTRSAFFGDDIDTDVTSVSFLRPFVPHPDVGETIGKQGIELEVAADEPFEAIAEVPVVQFLLAKFSEDVMDGDCEHGMLSN